MIKKKQVHQINIKVDDDDLAYLDAKAKRLDMSRSGMIKVLALNGEITVSMAEKLKHPKL